jgi:hypothetical protein
MRLVLLLVVAYLTCTVTSQRVVPLRRGVLSPLQLRHLATHAPHAARARMLTHAADVLETRTPEPVPMYGNFSEFFFYFVDVEVGVDRAPMTVTFDTGSSGACGVREKVCDHNLHTHTHTHIDVRLSHTCAFVFMYAIHSSLITNCVTFISMVDLLIPTVACSECIGAKKYFYNISNEAAGTAVDCRSVSRRINSLLFNPTYRHQPPSALSRLRLFLPSLTHHSHLHHFSPPPPPVAWHIQVLMQRGYAHSVTLGGCLLH